MTSESIVLPSYLCGEAVPSETTVAVHNPYDGSLVGRVATISPEQADTMVADTLTADLQLSRYERSTILLRARQLLAERREAFASLIRREAGLCQNDTLYEVGRAMDVFQFAALEALRDDGQVFSCDLTHHGKQRKIITMREPLPIALAITPFNHPLNQVAHKVAPAIAAGTPILVKPSEKTPLTAVKLAELLYEAGLPRPFLSVFLGDVKEVVEPLICHDRISLVTFTGGTAVGKRIAGIAGYKKLCLELGGNSPLIVLEDADLELAAQLAANGCFKNSGQRCTAVKRLLVQRAVLGPFTERFLAAARKFVVGDPADLSTTMGTVIDEAAAITLQRRAQAAVAAGARLLAGGTRDGALLEPTILADVPRDAEVIRLESFGPLAPIIPVDDLDDAIAVANDSDFGLSCGIVTQDLAKATACAKRIRTGTVNVNEVPGYRIETSPFGGTKDSGLGIKEGVAEAVKFMTFTKTFSIPW